MVKKRTWIAVGLGTLLGLGATLLSLLLAAAAVSKTGMLPEPWLPTLATLCGAVGAFVGGVAAAKWNGRSGLVMGVVSAALLSLLLLLLGRIGGGAIQPVFLLRLAALLPSGMVGGLWGVNRKR